MPTSQNHEWTIVAVSDAGDEARIPEKPDASLETLLTKAVHKLYGEHADVSKYEIQIDGTSQENLGLTLEQAGLHDGSEVVVQVKEVHRG